MTNTANAPRKMESNHRVASFFATALFVILCTFIAFPLVAGLLASFRPGRELVQNGLAINWDFSTMTLDNYKYLVNHDKNQFVDLAKYRKACTVDGWCVFPVSILTALGNGQGGGDYFRDDPLIGSWAFDTIEITNDAAKIEGFEEIEPEFID